MKINLLLLLCVFALACGTNKQEPMQEFVAKDAKFAIKYPKGWWFDSTRYAIVKDLDGQLDTYQESIVLGSEQVPLNYKVAEFAKAFSTSLKILDSTCTITKTEPCKIANVDAVKIFYNKQLPADTFSSCALFVVQDSTAFTVQANAQKSTFSKTEKEFNSIFNSITFLK